MNIQDINANIISQKDNVLIEIINNQSEYRREAIEVAKEELKKRKLDHEYQERIKENIKCEAIKNEDLSAKEKKILIFSFFYLFVNVLGLQNIFPKLPSALEFHRLGKIRKSKKTCVYKFLSYYVWIIILIIAWLIADSIIASKRYENYLNNESANNLLHQTPHTTRVR